MKNIILFQVTYCGVLHVFMVKSDKNAIEIADFLSTNSPIDAFYDQVTARYNIDLFMAKAARQHFKLRFVRVVDVNTMPSF